MKSCIIILILMVIVSESLCQNYTDERDKGIIGIGFQISYPFYGLSVIVNPDMDLSFQGMFGMFDSYKSYCGKIRYHMGESDAYAYALIGAIDHQTTEIENDGSVKTIMETTLGYGIGLGMEFLGRGTPLWFNFEVGYGQFKSDNPAQKKQAVIMGLGIHYYIREL